MKKVQKITSIKNQEFEIEPISANIETKDFFNPKKVKKNAVVGPYWGKPWGKI